VTPPVEVDFLPDDELIHGLLGCQTQQTVTAQKPLHILQV
jgi:hypothetical protein